MSLRPLVSIIMANRNGERFLEDAIKSVLCQTTGRIELILSDDASTDDSLAIAQRLRQGDDRVNIIAADARAGPGAARNLALDAARGDWVSIIDSDDLVHPARTERLIDRADRLGVDIIADDLVCFGANTGRTLLGPKKLTEPWRPTPADFLQAEMASPPIPVGYLKPIIHRRTLNDIRYRTDMSVGEDFDFLFRLLLAGAKMAVLAEGYYLYRRHPGSISHRLGEEDAAGMVRSVDDLMATGPAALSDLLAARRRMHLSALNFARLVRLLKSRRVGAAIQLMARHPGLARPLLRSARESVRRRLPVPRQDTAKLDLLISASTAEADGYEPVAIPGGTDCWPLAEVSRLVEKAGRAPSILRAHGRAGLEALGYCPGWQQADLIAPEDGWTTCERQRIASLPWPVTMR
ncbi:MAG: glycosyltransferase family 2 protein [Silicimonas sp.]|nr:glycosyltransferase family 2 protein [Silicimonas sp.]